MGNQTAQSLSLGALETVLFICSLQMLNLATVLGNALLIGAFFKYKTMRKNQCTHLLAALAVSDFTGGAFGFVVTVPSQLFFVLSKAPIVTWQCFGVLTPIRITTFVSQMLTLSIAIDRFQLFKDPLAYDPVTQRKFASRSTKAACLYAFLVYSASFFGVDFGRVLPVCTGGAYMTKFYRSVNATCFWLLSLGVFLFYLAGLRLGRNAHSVARYLEQGERLAEAERLERQIKITRAISRILACYLLAWVVPNILFQISLKIGGALVRWSSRIIGIGIGLNAASNVVIFYFYNELVRKYLIRFAVCKGEPVEPLVVQPKAEVKPREGTPEVNNFLVV